MIANRLTRVEHAAQEQGINVLPPAREPTAAEWSEASEALPRLYAFVVDVTRRLIAGETLPLRYAGMEADTETARLWMPRSYGGELSPEATKRMTASITDHLPTPGPAELQLRRYVYSELCGELMLAHHRAGLEVAGWSKPWVPEDSKPLPDLATIYQKELDAAREEIGSR